MKWCCCNGHARWRAQVDRKLEEIILRLAAIQRYERIEMTKIDDVKAKQAELLRSVESETDLVQSVKTLLEGQSAQIAALRQQLKDAIENGSDPAALQEVLDGMTAILSTNEVNKQATADAVVANTPPA